MQFGQLQRREFISLLAAGGDVAAGGAAQTPKAGYPTNQCAHCAGCGGRSDGYCRAMLADKLSAMWGQQVCIENKRSAGNNIGADAWQGRCSTDIRLLRPRLHSSEH